MAESDVQLKSQTMNNPVELPGIIFFLIIRDFVADVVKIRKNVCSDVQLCFLSFHKTVKKNL